MQLQTVRDIEELLESDDDLNQDQLLHQRFAGVMFDGDHEHVLLEAEELATARDARKYAEDSDLDLAEYFMDHNS